MKGDCCWWKFNAGGGRTSLKITAFSGTPHGSKVTHVPEWCRLPSLLLCGICAAVTRTIKQSRDGVGHLAIGKPCGSFIALLKSLALVIWFMIFFGLTFSELMLQMIVTNWHRVCSIHRRPSSDLNGLWCRATLIITMSLQWLDETIMVITLCYLAVVWQDQALRVKFTPVHKAYKPLNAMI